MRSNSEIMEQIFKLVNFIVEERIAKPRQIRELFDALPQGARDAIQKRDA